METIKDDIFIIKKLVEKLSSDISSTRCQSPDIKVHTDLTRLELRCSDIIKSLSILSDKVQTRISKGQ